MSQCRQKIHELEEIVQEVFNIKKEKKTEGKITEEKKRTWKMWYNFKLTNIRVIGVPKGEMGKGGGKKKYLRK